MKGRAARILTSSLLLLALAGCGAPKPQIPDQQRCEQACQKLIGCGVLYDTSCVAGCLASTIFLPCLRESNDDCGSMARCALWQAAAQRCTTGGGVPDGGASCRDTLDCQRRCNAMSAPIPCTCGCATQLAPSRALNLLVISQCAAVRCASDCRPGSSGPACNVCLSQQCQGESAQCDAS